MTPSIKELQEKLREAELKITSIRIENAREAAAKYMSKIIELTAQNETMVEALKHYRTFGKNPNIAREALESPALQHQMKVMEAKDKVVEAGKEVMPSFAFFSMCEKTARYCEETGSNWAEIELGTLKKLHKSIEALRTLKEMEEGR